MNISQRVVLSGVMLSVSLGSCGPSAYAAQAGHRSPTQQAAAVTLSAHNTSGVGGFAVHLECRVNEYGWTMPGFALNAAETVRQGRVFVAEEEDVYQSWGDIPFRLRVQPPAPYLALAGWAEKGSKVRVNTDVPAGQYIFIPITGYSTRGDGTPSNLILRDEASGAKFQHEISSKQPPC